MVSQTVRLPENLATRLDALAAATRRSKSSFIVEALERHLPVILVDGPGIARDEVGNARTANTVLLGALATKLDIPGDIWRAAIYRSVPPGTEKLNMLAFEAGGRVARDAEKAD